MERMTWDQYFLQLAKHISERSTCLRRRVGAVAVKNRRILATGYNGAPMGIEHCTQTGCLRERMKIPSGERHELCRATHAEQNVICQAARFGISLEDAGLYISGGTPCMICSKQLINTGIRWVVTDADYPDTMSRGFLSSAGIGLEVHDEQESD